MADILKAKRQLGEINMLLKQGKLLAAVASLHEALTFIMSASLMKHELQSFIEALDKAAYLLSNDRELKKIYPLQISYKPGDEQELYESLTALFNFLQENLTEEVNAQIASNFGPEQQLAAIRDALQGGDMAWAQHVARKLVESAPSNAEIKVAIADIFLQFSHYDEALEYLKTAYTDNPDSAHIFNKLGMTLRKSGRLEEAEKFYIQALERQNQSQNHIIYFNLGRVYLDQKRWKNAITAAERALSINPDFVEAQKMKLFATKQLTM